MNQLKFFYIKYIGLFVICKYICAAFDGLELLTCYAGFTLHDFCYNFHSPTVLWKPPKNARNQGQISDNHVVGYMLLKHAK